MAEETAPYGRITQKAPAVSDVHIVWMTAGLGCDGDSVSITAASQPSVEDVVLGAIPGLPKVHLHNPVLAYEVGDDFLSYWYKAEKGELDPFVLVVEGSIPNESIKSEGYWAALGTDPSTGQPITTNEWIDRLAPKALAVVAIGTCATYGGIHAMQGNPTGCMGLADYLGWEWRSFAGIPIVNVPGCPVQPDNFMETVLYLLYQAAGLAPMIPLDEALRPTWLFGKTVHAQMHRQARMLGPRRQLQRSQAWLDGRNRRVPERRGNLYRLYDAGLPRQVHAVHGRAPGLEGFHIRHRHLRPRHHCAPQADEHDPQQGTQVAAPAR
jgi:hydrogenase small subunit